MFVAKTKETSKGLEKYRPRLSIEITEEQAAKLYQDLGAVLQAAEESYDQQRLLETNQFTSPNSPPHYEGGHTTREVKWK